MMNAPELTPCPQCGYKYCGPWACKFSGISHAERREESRVNDYAQDKITRDKLPAQKPENDLDLAGRALRPGR